VDLGWVVRAAASLDELSARHRRNIGRQLGLDAVSVSMAIR